MKPGNFDRRAHHLPPSRATFSPAPPTHERSTHPIATGRFNLSPMRNSMHTQHTPHAIKLRPTAHPGEWHPGGDGVKRDERLWLLAQSKITHQKRMGRVREREPSKRNVFRIETNDGGSGDDDDESETPFLARTHTHNSPPE